MRNKRQKLQKIVSYDNGITWQDVPGDYTAGTIIEYDSPDCNNIEYVEVPNAYTCESDGYEIIKRWVTTGNYLCDGVNKYAEEIEKISYDSGNTWTPTGNEREGRLIEVNSEDCGYVPESAKAELIIEGNLRVTVFDDQSGEITSTDIQPYKSDLYSVTIYTTVDTIGQNAFAYAENMSTLNFSNTVTTINAGAFNYCSSLILTTLPDSLTYIGNAAFKNSGLVRIDIPDAVTTIGEEAFSDNHGMMVAEIGTNIQQIGASAFANCDRLMSITINAVTPPTLGNFAFYNTGNCPIYVIETSRQVYRNAWPEYADRIFGI